MTSISSSTTASVPQPAAAVLGYGGGLPILVVIDIPGCTDEQYHSVVSRVGLALPDAVRPPGMLMHSAGRTGDGWIVVDVWERREDYEVFAQRAVGPAVREVGVPTFTPRVVDLAALIR